MRRPARLLLALFALVAGVLAWRTVHAETPRTQRVAATLWLAVGGPETVGVELSAAHRLMAGGWPLWITWGGAFGHVGFACDGGDDCDAQEHQLFAGVGLLRCTNQARTSGLCAGATATLAGRRVQEWWEFPDPPLYQLVPQIRGLLEAGGTVRFRLGLRVETLPARYVGDACREHCPIARVGAEVGLVTAW